MFWNFCPSLMTMLALPMGPGAPKLIGLAGAREVKSLVLSQVVCHCVRMNLELEDRFYLEITYNIPDLLGSRRENHG